MAKEEICIVIDTNVFVRAIAELDPEHRAYGAMIRKCHKLIVSEKIVEEYARVIQEYNYTAATIHLELSKLETMGKYRKADKRVKQGIAVGVDVPNNDRSFLEAAIALSAKYLVTKDGRHFLSNQQDIQDRHGISVVTSEQYYHICENFD